jgi:hypothetical protein
MVRAVNQHAGDTGLSHLTNRYFFGSLHIVTYASPGSIPFSIRSNVGNRAIWAATRRASLAGWLVFEVNRCQVQAGGVLHFISAIAFGDAPRSHEPAGLGWSRFAGRYFLRALGHGAEICRTSARSMRATVPASQRLCFMYSFKSFWWP